MFPTAHRRAHCIDCGVNLFGLSKRCLECGRPFDPADVFSYSPPPQRIAPWSWAMTALFAAAVVAGLLT